MTSQEFQVLSAFNLLCNTPSETIQTHRELATKTIKHVVKILNTSAIIDTVISGVKHGVAHSLPEFIPDAEISRLSPAINGSSQHADAQYWSSSQRPIITSSVQTGHGTAQKRKRDTLEKDCSVQILQRVKQNLPHILDFSKQQVSLSEILHDEQETQYRDKRVDHLKQVDGNKTPSNEQKLLKGLSQISLAKQFTAWERERGWKAKVDDLYDNLQASTNAKYQHIGNNRSGKIARYMRYYGYPQSDHNVLKKGISRGVSQLLFERLLSDAFKHQDGHAAVQGVVAMVTIFEYSQFQCLKLADLPKMIALLLGERGRVFGDAAKEISVWFEHISSDFQLISRNPGRSMDKVRAQNNYPQPPMTVEEAGTYSSAQNNSRSSEAGAQSFESNATVFPRMSPHELSTLSTVPRNGYDVLKQDANASFPAVRLDDSAPALTQSIAPPRLAEFSMLSNHVTHDHTGLSFPVIIPHELSSFSTNHPARITPNALGGSAPHSEFQFDIQNTLSRLPLDSNTTRMA